MRNHTIVALLVAGLPLLAAAQGAPPATPILTPTPTPTPTPAAPTLPAPTGPIGSVALVTGSVKVGERSLGTGDAIHEGETIVVGPNSYANLKFNDGGRVLLRPNSEFAVESFRTRAPLPATTAATAPAAAAPVEGLALFRLVRGGFRAISGLIGHGEQQSYAVRTPAATIGIRGTDYEVQTCSDDCPSQAQAISGATTQVAANELAGLELAAANGGGGGGGIIVATNEGAITLHTPQGDTVVDAGKVAVSLGSQVVMLPKVPDLLLLAPTPSPKACE